MAIAGTPPTMAPSKSRPTSSRGKLVANGTSRPKAVAAVTATDIARTRPT